MLMILSASVDFSQDQEHDHDQEQEGNTSRIARAGGLWNNEAAHERSRYRAGGF
jgi:hypothetical protein